MQNYLNEQEQRFYQLLEQPKIQNYRCKIYNMSKPVNGFTHEQYQDELFQKAYLLKYGRAYFEDYRNLFEKIIKKLTVSKSNLANKKTLNILSIGCGAGLDYEAALHAYNGHNVKLSYIGIDVVDWQHKIGTVETGAAYFQISIDDIRDELIKHFDFIIFPRSVTDISEESLIAFAEKLVNINQEIYILFALVHSYKSINSQIDNAFKNINSIIDTLEKIV